MIKARPRRAQDRCGSYATAGQGPPVPAGVDPARRRNSVRRGAGARRGPAVAAAAAASPAVAVAVAVVAV